MKKGEACTFVIPVYITDEKTEYLEYFKQTMNSIFNQTCTDWSVVIVDNNSKNRLLARMTVLAQANHTATRANNTLPP